MIVVNAATAQADAEHFKQHLSDDAAFEDASDHIGKLDLQGPKSYEPLARLIGDEVGGLKYYRGNYFSFLGDRVIISRTGYTGELGYEIYAEHETIRAIWRMLLGSGEVKPAGLGSRDTLRLEMGYVLYGQDISSDTTPLEAGLDKFVDFKKDFIGKEALLKQKKEGVKRFLISFQAQSRRAPRHNYQIFLGDKPVGIVTSGSYSPSLGCGIGMGYVNEKLKPGAAITVREGPVVIDAIVTEKPFYRKGTARSK